MARALERPKHWAELNERGADWGPSLMAFVYRTLGRSACLGLMAPVIFYFYIAGFQQRRASLNYLRRVWAASGRKGQPGHWQALIHFFSFGESLVDKFAAWIGNLHRSDIEAMDGGLVDAMRGDPRGALILSAHFGATEVIRAMAAHHQRRRINVVIHTKNARRFNDLIKRFAPQSLVALVEATEFDVSTAVELSAAIERGEWVVIMGDRMPVTKTARAVTVDFLGAPAAFPQGPFLLAAALRCPTYMLFCSKEQGRHRIHFSQLSEGVTLQRRNRMAGLQAVVEHYARELEARVKAAPYQWFNFYNFWAAPLEASRGGTEGRG